MARYAHIENGVAVEVIDTGDYAIEQLFAPALVAAISAAVAGRPGGLKLSSYLCFQIRR